MDRPSEITKRIKCGSCEVVGLGRSNFALIDYLLSVGAGRIVARDKVTPPVQTVERYSARGVVFQCGEHYLDGIGSADSVIFRTPVIRPDIEAFTNAIRLGAILTSEIELFMLVCPCPIVGVTGSDGKTTTTTIIHKLLSECGTAFIGGNIGVSPFVSFEKMKKADICVLELSSFQLQEITTSPDIAVLTNISPNHLNWHIDLDEYATAKSRIYGNGCKRLVVNADNAASLELLKSHPTSAEPVVFSMEKCYEELKELAPDAKAYLYLQDGIITVHTDREFPILAKADIKLAGAHNVANYMAAIGATLGMVSREAVCKTAVQFGGVEHRLELFRELDGVKYYNSSIDTSPSRTIAALSAFSIKPIIICGGSDKHISFEPLALELCKRAKAIVLTGQTAPAILAALKACPALDDELVIVTEGDFKSAVLAASRIAVSGDVVLLSPACASFDAFKDFEARGRAFKEIINSL